MDTLLAWVSHYGYPGLFTLLLLGIVGLPIPDETLLVFSGYLISRGRLHAGLTFLAGFAGSSCGISISYILGRTVGYGFVHRYGRYLHLNERRVDRIRAWFHRIGDWLLTICYFIPGLRHFAALIAGMSLLEYRTFALFAYPGAALWVATFLALGYFVGESWRAASAAAQRYILTASIVTAVLGAAVWWVHRRRRNI